MQPDGLHFVSQTNQLDNDGSAQKGLVQNYSNFISLSFCRLAHISTLFD